MATADEVLQVIEDADVSDLEGIRLLVDSRFGPEIAELFRRVAIDKNAEATSEWLQFLRRRNLVTD